MDCPCGKWCFDRFFFSFFFFQIRYIDIVGFIALSSIHCVFQHSTSLDSRVGLGCEEHGYMGKLVMRNGKKGSKDSIGCDPRSQGTGITSENWYSMTCFDRERDLGGER